MNEYNPDINEGLQEKERQEIKSPSLYKVYLLNDDYTTMEFVVLVLEKVFHISPVKATQIMLHVHKNGKGLAGIFTHEIAETKTADVIELARQHNFPLQCTMEKE